jgi:hypothetical protein
MAYISTESVKVIRYELKEAFPAKDGWKLSIVRRDSHLVDVTVVNAPYNMLTKGFDKSYEIMHAHNVNQNSLTAKAKKDLSKMFKIINKENYDNSDIQTDYFDVGFYCYLSVGSYSKPFSVSKKKAK